jgi:hypothetical protein
MPPKAMDIAAECYAQFDTGGGEQVAGFGSL